VSVFGDDPVVVPSLLAADPVRLASEVLDVVDAGAPAIHVDVMDGHFVPSLAFSAATVAALKETFDGRGTLLDVHLMVTRPARHISEFAAAGAGLITVHAEADLHPRYALDAIHDAGLLAGLAVRPSTSVSALARYADEIDVALCMTVEPGRGGQAFLDRSLTRIDWLTSLLRPHTPIEVDGGIDARTGRACVGNGATILVAGSAIFGAGDPGTAYEQLVAATHRRAARRLEAA